MSHTTWKTYKSLVVLAVVLKKTKTKQNKTKQNHNSNEKNRQVNDD